MRKNQFIENKSTIPKDIRGKHSWIDPSNRWYDNTAQPLLSIFKIIREIPRKVLESTQKKAPQSPQETSREPVRKKIVNTKFFKRVKYRTVKRQSPILQPTTFKEDVTRSKAAQRRTTIVWSSSIPKGIENGQERTHYQTRNF